MPCTTSHQPVHLVAPPAQQRPSPIGRFGGEWSTNVSVQFVWDAFYSPWVGSFLCKGTCNTAMSPSSLSWSTLNLSSEPLHLGVLHSISIPEALWPSSSVVHHPPSLALPHINCCLIGFKLMGNHDLQPYLCPQHNVQTCRCPGRLGGKPCGLHRHLRLLHLPKCDSSTVPTPATLQLIPMDNRHGCTRPCVFTGSCIIAETFQDTGSRDLCRLVMCQGLDTGSRDNQLHCYTSTLGWQGVPKGSRTGVLQGTGGQMG
jgi:hypothetical protein